MSLQIPAINDQDSAGTINVAELVFGQEYNETLVHQLVVRYLSGSRAGTKAQKTRAEVSGGGAKPWRQKGTGRARAGTVSSPIWRSGGQTFAAKPRSYTQKFNKKMYRAGVRSIFSELLRQNRLVTSSEIEPSTPKTKELVGKLGGLKDKKVLIVADKLSNELSLSSRNLPNVMVDVVSNVNPVSLVAAETVIVTPGAIRELEEWLS